MLQDITISKITTKPTSLNEKIEQYLHEIFEKELNAKGSILVSYTPFVIKKIAAYLSGRIKMPASIGIAGETASGKSTITMDLIDTIESFATEFNIDNAITRVNTDDYYYDRSEMVKKAGSFAEFAKPLTDFDGLPRKPFPTIKRSVALISSDKKERNHADEQTEPQRFCTGFDGNGGSICVAELGGGFHQGSCQMGRSC